MKPRPPIKLQPSVVMALELIGLGGPQAPEGRTRTVMALIDEYLGAEEVSKMLGRRLFIAGNSVIRSAPIRQGGTILFWELLDIVHVQLSLVGLNISMRGAITFGEVGARPNVLFGSGIDEAERLRDELAEEPRVIVDPRLIREAERNAHLRAKHHTVLEELGYIKNLLREDADGVWFVDYVRASRTEVGEPHDQFAFLAAHRRFVEGKLAGSTTLDRTSRAWTWLRTHHNRVVQEWFTEGRFDKKLREELRIPPESPLVYAFPPSAKAPG